MADELRVVQWTTGNVAVEVVKAIMRRPDIELVGAYAYSADKVGVDIGRLCDIGRDLGVCATNNVDALLALHPDCVIYTPLHFGVDEVQRILRAGVNIVTSAEFLTGRNLSEGDRAAVDGAAKDGGATIFGSGMNPGFAQLVAAIASGVSTDVRHASLTESVDVSQFIGDANFQSVGWGRPKDDPGHADDVRRGTAVFAEAVDVLARMMHVDLEKIGCDVAFAYATEDVVADGVSILAGHVGGMDVKWYGTVGDQEVLTVQQRWVACQTLEPPWRIEHGYRVEIVGDPNVYVKVDLMPTAADLADLTADRMRGIGLRITAAPLVNAIPAVCAARPGIVTYAELPTVAARIFAR
ncbi:dihydrodipicolinate reductase [Mycobacterium cookii]|uniref:Dihydrodipicolinate reductase n=1 Tax=Mycobacterium cookii TaxID=1775 RepID=A0A7I7KYV7_9MYCO|nr:dihydrodipicolinate reductase [Mycobacterium cookii]MCV7330564.1 dihydrodipicolinate reductase [Mycobacterium cookii]BBX47245.1 dihydrodipicolinate reductase [Mycobacterium cookii]